MFVWSRENHKIHVFLKHKQVQYMVTTYCTISGHYMQPRHGNHNVPTSTKVHSFIHHCPPRIQGSSFLFSQQLCEVGQANPKHGGGQDQESLQSYSVNGSVPTFDRITPGKATAMQYILNVELEISLGLISKDT